MPLFAVQTPLSFGARGRYHKGIALGEVMSNSVALITSSSESLNEVQRLEALHTHDLLGSAHEAEFDALARLAALLCDTPMATLSWVTDTQVVSTAQHGLALVSTDSQGTPHAHVVNEPERLLIVPNLRADKRFAGSALLQQQTELRFFAGAAIVDEQGLALGCLAVYDTLPHDLTPTQCQGLLDLACLARMTLSNRTKERALARLTTTDGLTGLSNRGQFQQALDVELAHAMRKGEPFTVLRMELDGFRAVNEGFGHAAGEEVLCEVARRLTQQVRLGDVLARLGSDAFGVVMRHGNQDDAQILAKRVVKAVSAPITLSTGDEIGVGISIGMAAYTDAVESTKQLLAQADQALFQAKKQNEQRWKMFVGIR